MKLKSLTSVAVMIVALFGGTVAAASPANAATTPPGTAQGAVRLTPSDLSTKAVTPIISWANSRYVTARLSQTSAALQARASAESSWEQYQSYGLSDGSWAIQSLANGLFVTARISQTDAPLQARAASISGWENSASPTSDDSGGTGSGNRTPYRGGQLTAPVGPSG
ncbi:fascin domain-containing protein [Micromonospora citrea]|uniref:fascin domain-containing protein n=1 Tax=Micromonospora citrea TaxID=47855 RepID=UPI003C5A2947